MCRSSEADDITVVSKYVNAIKWLTAASNSELALLVGRLKQHMQFTSVFILR